MRKARRTCPAVGNQICTLCCGTKRLTEIRCPADCVYLTAAREHPPAAKVRQQHRDLTLFVQALQDLNQRQSQLFVAVNTIIERHQPSAFQAIFDADISDACGALAATYETASRGVIYEHRAATVPGERLAAAINAMLREAGRQGGSAFERDVAVVLRRIEETVRAAGAFEPTNPRAYLTLLNRVMRAREDAEGRDGAAAPDDQAPRLIVP